MGVVLVVVRVVLEVVVVVDGPGGAPMAMSGRSGTADKSTTAAPRCPYSALRPS